MVGMAEQYLVMFRNSTSINNDMPKPPFISSLSHPLPLGILMEIDRKKNSEALTRPYMASMRVCYNCQQPGHITVNCPNQKVNWRTKFSEFERLEELWELQRDYETYQSLKKFFEEDKRWSKGKKHEESVEEQREGEQEYKESLKDSKEWAFKTLLLIYHAVFLVYTVSYLVENVECGASIKNQNVTAVYKKKQKSPIISQEN